MIGIASHLTEELLHRLLSSETIATEEKDAEAHLRNCAKCRANLESLAAGEKLWKEVGGSLRDSGIAAAPPPAHRSRANSGVTGEYCTHEAALPDGFFEPSDNPAMIGRLGRFEILEEFARGGMGIILKGYDRELNRYVAVKVLSPTLAASGAARKRFVREAQAAAGVVHPNVMPIHTVEAAGLLPYLVMPFVPGETLQDRIDREGPLSLPEVLRIAKQIAEALSAAHAQGIVHRDVKPGNVLLEKGVERAVLADFGLARAIDDATVTQYGAIAGTPAYMSPEQARGESIGPQSDLFSLGSVMYAMCAGVAPFRAETSLGVLRRISDAEPRGLRDINPDAPVWMERIVNKLQQKESADRYASAKELAVLLEKCLAHVQQPTRIPLPGEVATPWSLRPTWAFAAGMVLNMLLVLSIVLYLNRDFLMQRFWKAPAVSAASASKTADRAANEVERASGAATSARSTALDLAPEPSPGWTDGVDAALEELILETQRFESEVRVKHPR